MTDETKHRIDRSVSPVVTRVLKAGTAEQRRTYMMRGEPAALVNDYVVTEGDAFGDTETRIYPSLRGIIVGDQTATVEEAVAKATEVVAKLKSNGPEADLDERALGIDDEARDLSCMFEETGARIETIVHLGTMHDGDPTETLSTMVEELSDQDVSAISVHLPFLEKLHALRNAADEGTAADDDDGPMGGEEFVQEFLDQARQYGTLGFLVEVSVPEVRPTGTGSYSMHLGMRHLAVRYGSNYASACEAALMWAEAENARMRSAVPA